MNKDKVICCRKLSSHGAYQCGDFIDGRNFFCSKCRKLNDNTTYVVSGKKEILNE